MAQLVIRLEGDGALSDLIDAESPEGVQELIDSGQVVHLADDAEIVVSGLEGGMQSGAPSVVLGFRLPDGKVVMAETSWRLFATAFHALAGRFGTTYPDMQGMEILTGGEGTGSPSKLVIVPDEALRFVQCELCGARKEFPPEAETGRSQEEVLEPARWLYRHFREKHPSWAPPFSPADGSWDE